MPLPKILEKTMPRVEEAIAQFEAAGEEATLQHALRLRDACVLGARSSLLLMRLSPPRAVAAPR